MSLPRYRHNMRVEVTGGDPALRLSRMLTTLFQFMRAGVLFDAPEGPRMEGDAMVLEVVLETTCPVHTLDEDARVVITVSDAVCVECRGGGACP
jgi:hypothetical protein